MLVKYLLVALLPTFAYSRIAIHIKPSEKDAGASVDFRGEEGTVITDNEQDLFKIDNSSLKKASKNFLGRACSNIYLKPPTPWGDVFMIYGWDVVKSKLRPFHSSVTLATSKPVSLGVQEYINIYGNKNITQNINLTKEVEETIRHTWTNAQELGAAREIDYKINFGEQSVGGSTSLSYSAPSGKDPSKFRTVTVGNKTSAIATIPPGGKVLATLFATLHVIEIQIRYEFIVEGTVFCNYDQLYKGHHFYAIKLRDLQDTAHTPLNVYAMETISLSYYTNVRLETAVGTDAASKDGGKS